MTSQQFAVGALISLSIAIFTIVSTIYPLVVTSDKPINNINKEIIKLRDNLSLQYEHIPFDNFDDYQLIVDDISKSNVNNTKIFLSILAYREGKILGGKNSSEYFIENLTNNIIIKPDKILWYPLRQITFEKESKQMEIFKQIKPKLIEIFDKIKLNESFYQTKPKVIEILKILNQIHEDGQIFHKTKEEDLYCNDLKNNSIIDEQKKNNEVKDTSYCSIKEINDITEYSQNYPYVINIMNNYYENIPFSNLSHNFRLIVDYFQWFIIFSFIAGPIVFFMWIRRLY